VKAAKVNAGLAESNGKLLPGLWRELLHVTCGLTACTPGSAHGPTLGNEYGKTLPFTLSAITLLPVQVGQTRTCFTFLADRWFPVANTSVDHLIKIQEYAESGNCIWLFKHIDN